MDQQLANENKSSRLIRALDWSAFFTASIISFAVYVYTLAPTVTLEDSGELATAGAYLGVPHPPGYPIWTLISWIFTKIFAFVKFRGQPDPAWSIALSSAFFGALATGITAMLICRSGSDILNRSKHVAPDRDKSADNKICWVSGVVSSLVFAFSPCMWSQSVIVEVYSLNAFFLVLIFLLVYMWMSKPSDKLLYVTAFFFGLGLTNYQALLLAMLPLAVALFITDIKLCRDFIITGLPLLIMIFLFNHGLIIDIRHPLDSSCFTYCAINFIILTLAYFILPRGKTVAITILFAEIGVAFYAFMPIVSDLRNPPMNWGYPRTWEGFKHAVERGQYEKISGSKILSMRFLHQIGFYLSDLRKQFTLPITLLGFLPFSLWQLKTKTNTFKAINVAVILSLIASIIIFTEYLLVPTGSPPVTAVYKLLIAGIIIVGLVGGFLLFFNLALDLINRLPWFNIHSPFENDEFSIKLTIDEISGKWFVATLFGFLAMGIIFINLANLKMDIQDTFIQRVKFISSHALYAFWIGYGLLFGLAFLNNFFKRQNYAKVVFLGLAILLPLAPIYKNAYNKTLIKNYGGAEQTNHDYGWQFGNYQLRGAEAINEELDKDEEPLPNPSYPDAMTTNAVYFGGTDPGRFVPTYMIYSARVREDVYLITQNALADGTYMNVMRDLYGDQIWIPSQPDSSSAFQRYVQEVRAGKRQQNAQLKIEGGRVQVQGALGVMEINGILAEMIFRNNNYRHDFYVEESYVIRWMYPYLSPHGLIMKINNNPTSLDPSTINYDMDFWDWYTRKLIDKSTFRRDICARKSFSKLRSAIAGLYSNRRQFAYAEKAFNEARCLYPLSPEGTFRLINEVLLPTGKFEKAKELAISFSELDPKSSKIDALLKHINRLEKINARIAELEKFNQKMNIQQAMELMDLYMQAGRIGNFTALARNIIKNDNLPPTVFFQVAQQLARVNDFPDMTTALDKCLAKDTTKYPENILIGMAQMYAKAQNLPKMAESLQLYLKRKPADWKAWLDLAAVQIAIKKPDESEKSLDQAVKGGGVNAINLIQKDPRFATIRDRVLKKAQRLSNTPGIMQGQFQNGNPWSQPTGTHSPGLPQRIAPLSPLGKPKHQK